MQHHENLICVAAQHRAIMLVLQRSLSLPITKGAYPMSTRYTVQNNARGVWKDWAHYYNIDAAIVACKHISEQRPISVDDICSWRVIKEETVQIYPRNEVLHDRN